ncbi:hypothetical protein SK128_021955 [Halocaridina rubra]|uniref:Uncharacterized protein n=1 Tax=Halocaridina rubra TaxID=373956 RepID=A0AAN8XMJ6_HALRR
MLGIRWEMETARECLSHRSWDNSATMSTDLPRASEKLEKPELFGGGASSEKLEKPELFGGEVSSEKLEKPELFGGEVSSEKLEKPVLFGGEV